MYIIARNGDIINADNIKHFHINMRTSFEVDVMADDVVLGTYSQHYTACAIRTEIFNHILKSDHNDVYEMPRG